MDKYKKQTIKDWAAEDRPREKMLIKGTASLSDSDLIAILIRAGSINASAVEIAKDILQAADNNLNELGRWTTADFVRFKGIGEAKAVAIMSALELGRRRSLSDAIQKPSITSSRDAFEILHPIVADLPHEEFWVLYLNRANKVIGRERLSQGGVAGTVIDTKMVMKRGIELLASALILCHNHPSGQTKPSDADMHITRKLADAGKLLDIPVLDHIIVAGRDYYSFMDNGFE